MKKFMKNHDIILRLLSIVLAVVLWAVVMGVDNPMKPFTYDNVAVNLLGENELLEQTGLSVIEGRDLTAKVTVRGTAKEVTALRKGQLNVTVDLSTLTEAGEYELPLNSANVSITKAGIEYQSIKPGSIKVRVDAMTEKTVPVRAAISGAPADTYSAGKPAPTTKNVVVAGPAADVAEVEYALVTVSADGATATVRQDCAVTLHNEAGDPVTSPYVTSKTQTIGVTLPVYKLGTLPLTVTLKEGGTVTVDQATVTIDPDEVQVIGDQNAIAQMTELPLGEIDLGSVKTGTAITKSIDLPDGVRLVDGQSTTATVTVTIDGVDTSHVAVTYFVVTDTAAGQNARKVTVLTESVEIELRGTQSVLDTIDTNSFSIGLTIDSASLGDGTHEVKGIVVAAGLPDGVTLVDEDVQVRIGIEPPADGEAPAADESGAAA